MALWKARSLSPEQKVQIVEEESDVKCLQTEESESFLGIEDASMSEVYSSVLPITVSSLPPDVTSLLTFRRFLIIL